MELGPKYLAYWQKRRKEQQIYNRQLAEKARNNLSKIVDVLVGEFNASKIVLFGSLIKGSFGEGSDIDLAVAGTRRYDYFTALARVNELTDFWIDLKPIEDLDSNFLEKVLTTGEVLYERNVASEN
jgi:predicted nucleotidyltransferase